MDEDWLVDPLSSHNLFMSNSQIQRDIYSYPDAEIKPIYKYDIRQSSNNKGKEFYTNEQYLTEEMVTILLLLILVILCSMIYTGINNINKDIKTLLYNINKTKT